MRSKATNADLAGSRYLALQRLARAQNRTTAELLQLYALESFLRRLVRSPHDRSLVLKGGMLLAAFDMRRATRDVDSSRSQWSETIRRGEGRVACGQHQHHAHIEV